MQDFNDALDHVNAAADGADGFVWRYKTENDADRDREHALFGSDMASGTPHVMSQRTRAPSVLTVNSMRDP